MCLTKRRNTRTFRHHRRRMGAATVEFAVAGPILFFLILSIFEFGWAVLIRHSADNAAYEAARKAIVPGGTSADAINEANRIMGIVGARSFNVRVNPTNITEDTREVEVTVSGAFANNGIVASRIFPGVNFESATKMLTERPRRD
ncbi:MAG: TadE/TadG family type IV pilus assembly protein [Aureliella sp.]